MSSPLHPAADTVQQAWESLWDNQNPLYLPDVLRNGFKLNDHSIIQALKSLSLPDSGTITLFDETESGDSVAIELTNSQVAGLPTLESTSAMTYDASSGAFTVQLEFKQLDYIGYYEILSGSEAGSATTAALEVLGDDTGDITPVTLVQIYRDTLLRGPKGAQLVRNYYQDNQALNALFSLPSFQEVWATHTTDGKTTAYYLNEIYQAALPENAASSPLPGTTGDPSIDGPFNEHAFFMQNLMLSTLFKAASHYGTGTEKGKMFNKAANNATTFHQFFEGMPSGPTTMDGLIAWLTEPPAQSGDDETHDVAAIAHDPPRDRTQAVAPSGVENDLDQQTAPPAAPDSTGAFNAHFATPTLTLKGTLQSGPSGPSTHFATLEGDLGEITIQLTNLDDIDNKRFDDVVHYLSVSTWVKLMLGWGIYEQINSATLCDRLAEVMSLALLINLSR